MPSDVDAAKLARQSDSCFTPTIGGMFRIRVVLTKVTKTIFCLTYCILGLLKGLSNVNGHKLPLPLSAPYSEKHKQLLAW